MPARLQLVVPCYNEATRLNPEAFLQLVTSRPDTELLFVDDGSTDKTPAILADMAVRGSGKISVVTLPDNLGKALAVQRGVLKAFDTPPEFIGYWDADLSTPLAAVPDFMAVLEADSGIDIVIGARVRLLGRRINRSAVRHYCGRVFATAASLALQMGVYDTQCGAKIFRANELVRQAFTTPFQSRWILDVEILARYMGAVGTASAESRIYELPLRDWTEVSGSNLSLWHAVRALWDLMMIRRRLPSRPRARSVGVHASPDDERSVGRLGRPR